MKITWTKTCERILRLFEVGAIIAGVIFAMTQIRDLRNNESAQLMLKFNTNLSERTNSLISTTIEKNWPLLKTNGGYFTESDLDRYLSIFELLNNVSANGLISDDMLYNGFAYDAIKAYQNKEIAAYLKKIRKEDSDLFVGFETLAKSLLLAQN